MRMFLSSENFGKYPQILTGLVHDNKRVAYVGNAGDYKNNEEHAAKVAEHRVQFEGLGFEFVDIDLRQYFAGGVPMDTLDGFGLVWCSGGNTFLLRSAMRLSGFDEILAKKIKNDELAYGGSSAGSIIAGPTLRGTEHGDDPGAVAETYKTDVIWDGLGLVDFVIIPHWQSDWFGKDAARMRRALELDKSNTSYKTLFDGQVYLIDGDKEELLQ